MDENKLEWEIGDAIEAGDLAQVRALFEKFPAALEMDTCFGPWLHVAADFGQPGVVAYLLERGADINKRGGTFGGAAINEAASESRVAVVRQLLDAGAELDTSEPERNPLFSAIQEGSMEIVRLLIERGIDFRVSYTGGSMKNMDAEAFARERGQTAIADYLAALKKGAKHANS